MPFRVLHVCTGNICRSPMAEHLMRAGLCARLGDLADQFEVASAGTRGFAGEPMQPFAHSTLGVRGIDGSGFAARALVQDLVEEADLVLCATRAHRGKVAVLSPRAMSRSFTLREFDRLLSPVDPATLPPDPVARATELVRAAAANRGLVRPERPEDDDVDDPYLGPETGYLACAELVEQALERPLDLIAGPRPNG